MSYLNFLFLFICVPTGILIYLFARSKESDKNFNLKGIAILCILATLYTTPWDNYLVAKQVWWYGQDRVLGTIGYVPIEEYAFFVLQTIMTGLWSFFIIKKLPVKKSLLNSKKTFLGVKVLLIGVWLYGLFALTQESSFYMGLILSWATPILILQFFIGGKYVLASIRKLLVGAFIPTLYLWVADYCAISKGIWFISKTYTYGLNFFEILPLEEMVFFLVTNLMVVQGLILFNEMKGALNKFNMR